MPVKANAAVIVAHPDDETLWVGGTILLHPDWRWTIISLCRAGDIDRASKFRRVLKEYNAAGDIGDLDDGPEQIPLDEQAVRQQIFAILPEKHYDLIITHSPFGEYSHHRRHEETGKTVIKLWKSGAITSPSLWLFAYEDGSKRYLPRAISGAHRSITLPQEVLQRKYDIITACYGFSPDSYEARTTPAHEAFWCFTSLNELIEWERQRR